MGWSASAWPSAGQTPWTGGPSSSRSPTPGQSALDVANVTRERLLTQIFGGLTEADRATLYRLLGRLDEAVQQVITASVRPSAAVVRA